MTPFAVPSQAQQQVQLLESYWTPVSRSMASAVATAVQALTALRCQTQSGPAVHLV